MERSLRRRRRQAVERAILRRDGTGAGAGVLRLSDAGRHLDAVRRVRSQHRDVHEKSDHGAQARPGPAGRIDRRRDHPPGHRVDAVDDGLSPVPAGAPMRNDRQHRGRPVRLEYRHQRRGHGGAEFRHGQAAAARASLRDGSRIHGRREPVVRVLGQRRGGAGPQDRYLCRLHEGAANSF